jgi:chorismate synthase
LERRAEEAVEREIERNKETKEKSVGRRVSCFCQGFPVSYGASHAVTELVLLKKPYQILSFTV